MAKLIWEYSPVSRKWIRLLQGDITDEKVDAIVNAANSQLAHGGGVAGAIVRKGGYEIQEESYRVAPVAVGHCVITGAGKLPAKYVIHAVGPMWGEGDEENKLYNAISNSLKLADEKKLKSISFPAISSGIFGFPKEGCAQILLRGAKDFYQKYPVTSLNEIRFCIIDQVTVNIFHNEALKLKP